MQASEQSLGEGLPAGSTSFEDMAKACPTSGQVCDQGQQDSGQAVLGAQPSLSVQLGLGLDFSTLISKTGAPATHSWAPESI